MRRNLLDVAEQHVRVVAAVVAASLVHVPRVVPGLRQARLCSASGCVVAHGEDGGFGYTVGLDVVVSSAEGAEVVAVGGTVGSGNLMVEVGLHGRSGAGREPAGAVPGLD